MTSFGNGGQTRMLEPTDSRELNNIITDALAAYSPGWGYIAAAIAATTIPVLLFPLVHMAYVNIIQIFSRADALSDTSMQSDLYNAAMQSIYNYLPKIPLVAAAMAAVGAFFGMRRRRILRRSPFRKLFFWDVSATEFFSVILGWFTYYVIAAMPRYSMGGYYNLAGMLTVSGGWIWLTSGFLFSWYMHAATNAILWKIFRYRWAEAIPGIVKMMATHRLQLPSHGIAAVTSDPTTGSARIEAHIDHLNVARLRDDLLAVPGLRHPEVIALGPLPGAQVNFTHVPPRMKPLPPRAFKRPQGPPKGYHAEDGVVDATDKE